MPPGPNAGGSWIHSGFARSARGSIAVRKARSGSSAAADRRPSWVTARGSLNTKRKPGAVCPAHDATVSRAGVA